MPEQSPQHSGHHGQRLWKSIPARCCAAHLPPAWRPAVLIFATSTPGPLLGWPWCTRGPSPFRLLDLISDLVLPGSKRRPWPVNPLSRSPHSEHPVPPPPPLPFLWETSMPTTRWPPSRWPLSFPHRRTPSSAGVAENRAPLALGVNATALASGPLSHPDFRCPLSSSAGVVSRFPPGVRLQ